MDNESADNRWRLISSLSEMSPPVSHRVRTIPRGAELMLPLDADVSATTLAGAACCRVSHPRKVLKRERGVDLGGMCNKETGPSVALIG